MGQHEPRASDADRRTGVQHEVRRGRDRRLAERRRSRVGHKTTLPRPDGPPVRQRQVVRRLLGPMWLRRNRVSRHRARHTISTWEQAWHLNCLRISHGCSGHQRISAGNAGRSWRETTAPASGCARSPIARSTRISSFGWPAWSGPPARPDVRSRHSLPFRLGLLGNGTLDVIAAAIDASAARYGIDMDCVTRRVRPGDAKRPVAGLARQSRPSGRGADGGRLPGVPAAADAGRPAGRRQDRRGVARQPDGHARRHPRQHRRGLHLSDARTAAGGFVRP